LKRKFIMLTRKLALALALAITSTGALAATTTDNTDTSGRSIVQTTPVDQMPFFDPARELWIATHPKEAQAAGLATVRTPARPPSYAAAGTSTRDVAGMDESPVRESGAQIVEEQDAERRSLERSGFPQYSD
jgi:hypothetical protein